MQPTYNYKKIIINTMINEMKLGTYFFVPLKDRQLGLPFFHGEH